MRDFSALDTIPRIKNQPRQLNLGDESSLQAHHLAAAEGLAISALESGCIHSIRRKKILINQVLASPLGGGIHQIHLRIHHDSGISCVQIVGPRAASEFSAARDQFSWIGTSHGLRYSCTCRLVDCPDAWFFRIDVENQAEKPVRCDVVMVQDIGLAVREQIRNNETFSSQYLDYFCLKHQEIGDVLMIRQNLPQPGPTHPWLLQGCFPRAVGFTTDGFDFFGSAYKGSGIPTALSRQSIGQRVRQYEAGYTAMQSAEAQIPPSRREAFTFFCEFAADHPQPSSPADFDDEKLRDLRTICETIPWQAADSAPGPVASKKTRSVFQTAELFEAEDLNEKDVKSLFPEELKHEEFDAAKRLSFFCGSQPRHIVLKSKEIAVDRPHGHIMRAGRGVLPDAAVMSCSFYAAGVFASQMALGNTIFGRFISCVRDPLNIVRSGGMRIFVRAGAEHPWCLLGVPSAFEMSPEFCRWHYKGGGNQLTVTCTASEENPAFTYTIEAAQQPVELLICGEISAGPHEYESSPRLCVDSDRRRISIRPDVRSLLAAKYPAIVFNIVTATPQRIASIGGDELLASGHSDAPLPYFAIQSQPINLLQFTMLGSLDSQDSDQLCAKFESLPATRPSHAASSGCAWQETDGAMQIIRASSEKASSEKASTEKAAQIQDSLRWLARDAIIHFSVPRGLEQANGGAWGVRDVCQGPVEFLLSYDRPDMVKTILIELFSQQYLQRGDWPQWFMFAPFQEIRAGSCHGDIPIWPLKALCDYLEHSDDGEVLELELPYTDPESFARTDHRETILQHVDRLLERIRSQFLPGWSIPRYGEGDWDDSLQPVGSGLGERMASSWTMALLYQSARRYGVALARFGHARRAATVMAMADQIRADFQKCMMLQDVVAGFVIFDGQPPQPRQYLLHPSDSQTGIRYRLIPMVQGILANIFSPEQARSHLEIIQKHLVFPDGARLMDRPTRYSGGLESVFRRSESAAFFGREIGLQYVHAHLRYAEALAAMGHPEELLRALLVANPISVTEVVKNAELRQRNCYFSSSDADFRDRYEAQRDYEKLRSGDVRVRGGWRIYSSGPGVYTSLVVRHLLGLRHYFDLLEFDPVLPLELNGIECELPYNGNRMRFRFKVAGDGRASTIKRIHVDGKELTSLRRCDNPFRTGGLRIRKADFDALAGRLIEMDCG